MMNRKTFGKRLLGLFGAASLAPQLLAEQPEPVIPTSIDESPKPQFLPLPEGFERMNLPAVLIDGKAHMSKARCLRSREGEDYVKELHELGYTHLYVLYLTPELYDIETFLPYRKYVVRGLQTAKKHES